MRNNQDCPRCTTGVMVRYKTNTTSMIKTRYLKCDRCGHHGRERFIIKTNRRGRAYFCPLVGNDFLEVENIASTMGVIYHGEAER